MQLNFMFLGSFLILMTPVWSQYNNEIRPDVTFGDHNDRFDVSDLVSHQNQYFRADGSIDYRRRHGSKRMHKFLRTHWNPNDKKWLLDSERARTKFARRVKKETEEQLNKLANRILLRIKSMRRTGDDDFAFYNNMDSVGGDIQDFNENLKRFQTTSRKSDPEDGQEQKINYRRVGTAPDMFNYAFPIEMHVKGYLVPAERR